jgi:hypothetical protein
MIISVWNVLRMRNVSDKNSRKNENKRLMFNNVSENSAVDEIM